MPLYSYKCPAHGVFDALSSIAERADALPCAACRQPSPRVISSPHLNLGDASARRLLDATNETAERPQVVSRLPRAGRRSPRVATDPRTRKLPRP